MASSTQSQFYVSTPVVSNGAWSSSQSPVSATWGVSTPVSTPRHTSGALGVEELSFNPLSPMLEKMLSDHKSGQAANHVQGKIT